MEISFTGMALKAPRRRIIDAADAISQWDLMKHPKYTNIFQEEELSTRPEVLLNKRIREENYSFLDELKSDREKAKFIEYFKRLTGFPSLEDSSRKILEEFVRVLKTADNNLKSTFRPLQKLLYPETDNIALAGYDRFCSAGLHTSLPGSDLDKGYAILRAVDGGITNQKKYSDMFKGEIWENIDNRIMSVNHTAAFPNIMTTSELCHNLDMVDEAAKNFVKSTDDVQYFRVQRFSNPHLIPAARFNVWLTKHLRSTEDKYAAKNLSYIIEAIRDGKSIDRYSMDDVLGKLNDSIFVWCSNVSSGYRMGQQYDYSDVMKPKLKARKDVERNFNNWSISKQYELVKDVIRSMSGDNKNPEFVNLFRSANDRHRLLLNDILRGKVTCEFDANEYRERAILGFSTPELREKYQGINLYNFQYKDLI